MEHRDVTIGGRTFQIVTRKVVDPDGRPPFPSVATAFYDGKEIKENGYAAECYGATDKHAIESMTVYLERQYGPQSAA